MINGWMHGIAQIHVVDCAHPGGLPVLAAGAFKTRFTTQPGSSSYQAFPNMMFIAQDECTRNYRVANPDNKLNFAYPDKTTWDAGEQTILCMDPAKASRKATW